MIICVCKAVSDKAIRRHVATGEVVSLRDDIDAELAERFGS